MSKEWWGMLFALITRSSSLLVLLLGMLLIFGSRNEERSGMDDETLGREY